MYTLVVASKDTDHEDLSNDFEIRGLLVFITFLFALANFLVVLLMNSGGFGPNEFVFTIMSAWVGASLAQPGLLAVCGTTSLSPNIMVVLWRRTTRMRSNMA